MLTHEQENALIAATKDDSYYQELRVKCIRLESKFEQIKKQLNPDDWGLLEEYISLCEEMEYRRTCLAYQLGRSEG